MTNKLADVIQMQSIVICGYLARTRRTTVCAHAVIIERHWRGFLMRLNYGFTLINIIYIIVFDVFNVG